MVVREIVPASSAADRTPGTWIECRYCKKRKRWYGRTNA
jgi:hypothetical protein